MHDFEMDDEMEDSLFLPESVIKLRRSTQHISMDCVRQANFENAWLLQGSANNSCLTVLHPVT
jgi:hypothetical protein